MSKNPAKPSTPVKPDSVWSDTQAQVELDSINAKRAEVWAFLDTKAFDALPLHQQDILKQRHRHMSDYATTLEEQLCYMGLPCDYFHRSPGGGASQESPASECHLTPSEAIYGFVGWMNYRDENISMGASCNRGIMATLVGRFCSANNLNPPAEGWSDGLKYPDEAIDVGEVKVNIMGPQEAIAQVKYIMHADHSLAHVWHSNLAVIFQEVFNGSPSASNASASAFMLRCFGVETSNDMLGK